jgi:HPt (histidine-containing phosphotransfer) domain-containing protein
MYYILSETNQIIAADDSVLSLCGVAHIDELASSIIKGDTVFDVISDEKLVIKAENIHETFTLSKASLSSMLGQLTLVTLSTQDEEVASLSLIKDEDIVISPSSEDEINNIDIINSAIDSEEITKNIEDDITSLSLEETDDTLDEPITFDDTLSLDDDIMSLKDETYSNEIEEKTEDETKTETIDNSDLLNLMLDDTEEFNYDKPIETASETTSSKPVEDEPLEFDLDNDDLFLEKEEIADVSEINIDVKEISQKIGISTDDYNTFLDDFIDTALELEKDLQSNDNDTRSDAIGTLSHLSEVLHLPIVGDILTNIIHADNDNLRKEIESFYSTLSRITTSAPTKKEVIEEVSTKEEIVIEDIPEVIEEEKLELFDAPEIIDEPIIQEEIKPQKPSNEKSFGTISLEGIKAKHFDFQLEEAANDLSLPVELIEEFVHDFIDQAHSETEKMLEAYEKGDLDTIQKIGHLLKGASSNLRINPLSDTLYKIQFCEDSNNLETLIKDYWAHFLSFETQINVISN